MTIYNAAMLWRSVKELCEVLPLDGKLIRIDMKYDVDYKKNNHSNYI